jgi:hypothetical protein
VEDVAAVAGGRDRPRARKATETNSGKKEMWRRGVFVNGRKSGRWCIYTKLTGLL